MHLKFIQRNFKSIKNGLNGFKALNTRDRTIDDRYLLNQKQTFKSELIEIDQMHRIDQSKVPIYFGYVDFRHSNSYIHLFTMPTLPTDLSAHLPDSHSLSFRQLAFLPFLFVFAVDAPAPSINPFSFSPRAP